MPPLKGQLSAVALAPAPVIPVPRALFVESLMESSIFWEMNITNASSHFAKNQIVARRDFNWNRHASRKRLVFDEGNRHALQTKPGHNWIQQYSPFSRDTEIHCIWYNSLFLLPPWEFCWPQSKGGYYNRPFLANEHPNGGFATIHSVCWETGLSSIEKMLKSTAFSSCEVCPCFPYGPSYKKEIMILHHREDASILG